MDNSGQPSNRATTPTAGLRPEPAIASIVTESHGVTPSDSINVEWRLLRILHPRRSLGRRVAERLILGVAALLLYAGSTWIPFEAPQSMPILRGTIESGDQNLTAYSAAASADAPSTPVAPSWLSPDLFYMPAWPPPSPALPRAEVPSPLPRPTRQ